MGAIAPVRVKWAPKSESGFDVPPAGRRFCGISRFPEDEKQWSNGGWTVVIEFDRPPAEQGPTAEGVAHFLREEAPHERLSRGGVFELYTLKKRVAEVEVTGA